MAAILIADDVALARESLARALRERGHRVVTVADGQEALERFQRDRPDLVILDVTMPRLSGLDACARMKGLPGPFTPTIMLSARDELEVRLSCLAVAEDFVPKPYDAQEICARVEAHLRTRRLIDERAARTEAVPPVAEPKPAPRSELRTISVGGIPGICDRASFLERLTDEWKRAARTNDPLAVLVVGVDAPPRTASGEASMGGLAAVMHRCLRELDVLARSDETHLCGLLQGVHVTGAITVAERLRRELRKLLVDGEPAVVSMGIAVYPGRDVAEPADLLRVAERAIVRAREEGPGRICLYQHQGYLFEPA